MIEDLYFWGGITLYLVIIGYCAYSCRDSRYDDNCRLCGCFSTEYEENQYFERV